MHRDYGQPVDVLNGKLILNIEESLVSQKRLSNSNSESEEQAVRQLNTLDPYTQSKPLEVIKTTLPKKKILIPS